MKSARLILASLALALVLAVGVTSVAPAATGLTVAKARKAIKPIFVRELSNAGGAVSRERLGPCSRRSARVVVCRSSARVTQANGDRFSCTKSYRAKMGRRGKVSVSETVNGRTYRRFVRSRCVLLQSASVARFCGHGRGDLRFNIRDIRVRNTTCREARRVVKNLSCGTTTCNRSRGRAGRYTCSIEQLGIERQRVRCRNGARRVGWTSQA